MSQTDDLLHRLEELNAIGVALSSAGNINRLLEEILVAAKRITNADAGTLYLVPPIAMPSVRKIQAASVQGRTPRAHAASIRPSISAATAKAKEIEQPT